MNNTVNYCGKGFAYLLGMLLFTSCQTAPQNTASNNATDSAAKELILPDGFSASVVADSLGALRHLAVNKNGDIFVKLSKLKNGNGILFLSDTDKDGKMDKTVGFANYPGTGIRIQGNKLYSSSNSAVYKYELNAQGQVIDTAKAEVLVQGLVDKGRDNAKSIALDNNNNLYVAIGSYDETCTDAAGNGLTNCKLLDSVGGIWQFSTDKLNQSYSNSVHYAKGLKNVVGLDWNTVTKSLFVAPHGRGGLKEKFPKLYTQEQEKALPAETLYELSKGSDGGWPYVYYDPFLHKNIVAPEYGGDGKKSIDKKYLDPVADFPAHLAPNDLLFYTGNMFPEKYKNGAFIVFHGQSQSMNKGYLVAFVPFLNGKPSGPWEIFADNFAGVDFANPKGPYKHRPMGIAQGPDGALYAADDLKGTIFKIIYQGDKN
ncbi:PQQ-dependent sugar dehydrogenase [Pedobacter antarcticus]|uniref:PQQ-dependent sugar dehydrogenase n=1 Tax=Pedobacter antarcticus TaxID=34086 RepID=UPI00292F3A92|nr:PQQ-dependent sugar dehydrogenase [Pedobacter antarcticus]